MKNFNSVRLIGIVQMKGSWKYSLKNGIFGFFLAFFPVFHWLQFQLSHFFVNFNWMSPPLLGFSGLFERFFVVYSLRLDSDSKEDKKKWWKKCLMTPFLNAKWRGKTPWKSPRALAALPTSLIWLVSFVMVPARSRYTGSGWLVISPQPRWLARRPPSCLSLASMKSN